MLIVFHDARFDSVAGAQRSLVLLAKGLLDRGYDILVLTDGAGRLSEFLGGQEIPVQVVAANAPLREYGYKGKPQWSTIQRWLRGVRHAAQLAKCLQVHNADVVAANSLRSAVYLSAARALGGPPLIWYIRGGHPQGFLSVIAAMASSRIVLISWGAAKAIPRWIRWWVMRKATVNYIGVELEPGEQALRARLSARRKAARIRVLTVCAVSPRKGLDTLLQAFARLRGLPIEGVVVGSAVRGHEEYYNKLLHTSSSLGLPIRWVGHTERPWEWYEQADVFVLASYEEGLGRAVLEAMSCGLPCIVTAAGGSEECVEPGVSGIVVSPGDEEALAGAIRAVAEDDALRIAMGQASRRRVAQQFNAARYVDGFVHVVETVAHSRHS